MSRNLSEVEQEKEEQVWKSFTHILENFYQIFGKEKIKMDDFLVFYRLVCRPNHYRKIVPATVDVVNVKSYDLIEPHTVKYVYASDGQSNFPKVARIPVY